MMRRGARLGIAGVILWLACIACAHALEYFPGTDWQHREPAQEGLDAARLKDAVDFAIASESKLPRDLSVAHYMTFGREPFGVAVGPFQERGAPTGVIVRHGYIVAEWGEPARVDMTFSVTKSFLSSVIGVAFDRGMIASLDDPVARYMPPVLPYALPGASGKPERLGHTELLQPFETPHNRTITWDHMLRQTSDWEGTLWGKPDWADRPSDNRDEWLTRKRNAPGTSYKYNDVRVNALALAALNVWRRPLPQVLRETIMDPIGASNRWRWLGYESSWVVMDGVAVQSVSGGGHWGGGMFIDAYDMARFGYFTLREGRWKDRQILSREWVRRALTPTPVQRTYGFMNWYLNQDRQLFPSAPARAFAHIGNGTNVIYVDPEHDVVAVVRWIEYRSVDEFLKRLTAAIAP
ncbi:MAG TPA: serine hydrolase [Usitatibacter sp.]|nr:serine hydrolase [Usitatibacter sp.]